MAVIEPTLNTILLHRHKNDSSLGGPFVLRSGDTMTGTLSLGANSLTAGSILANSNDVGALGASGTAWSDLFLASGGVINFNNGNVTITHSAGVLTLNDTAINVGTAGTLRFGSANDAITQGGSALTFMADGVNRLTIGGDASGIIHDILSRTINSTSIEVIHSRVNTRNITLPNATTIGTFRKVVINQDTLNGTAGGGTETVTDAATFYIAGAPINGGNLTLTNPYALWVDAGAVRLDGAITGSTSLSIRNDALTNIIEVVNVTNGNGVAYFFIARDSAAVTKPGSIKLDPDTTSFVLDNALNVDREALTATTVVQRAIISNTNAITTNTGATAVYGLTINEPNITVGSLTPTNSASLYISGAATEASNNYALWVDAGNVQVDGGLLVDGFLKIPQGAGGTTVDATGEVTIDSTSKTLNFYDGTNEVVLNPVQSKSFVIETPVATDDLPIWATDVAITLLEVRYLCIGGTNWVGQLQEGDANGINGVDVSAADTTATAGTTQDVTTFNNTSIDAGDWVLLKTTSISGTPTSLHITFYYRENA